MKRMLAVAAAILLGMLATPHAKASNASQAFEKLKALVGDWELQDPAGRKATMRIDLVSQGSALLERYVEYGKDGKQTEMITMYFLDGDDVKLTHYCAAGNQPTMKGEYSPETRLLTFHFVSATNLKSLDDGHMYHAVYKFVDKDRFETTWTLRKQQKDSFSEAQTFVRKR